MMGIFLIHILKSSVCLALLYLCYRMLLSKETFHRFNRIALLSLPVLSLAIPFIEITMPGASDMPLSFIPLEEATLMTDIKPEDVLIEMPKRFPWNTLILSVYAGGILFLLVRQVWSLGRMWYLLRTSRKEKMDKGITLCIHRKKIAPFSWMKLIAISEDDLQKNGKAILAHERAHILNRHSWDMLLAQVCVFLQWFNPAAWFWMHDLRTIHEYEADEWVVRHDMDARSYQLSIIESVVGTRRFSMANSFNQSLLNKRITMMNKGRSHRWARLKCLFVLPAVTLSVVAFAHPEISRQFDKISIVTEETSEVANTSGESIKVSGTVLMAHTKEPIAGANVIVRNTTHGTLTDIDGNFNLQAQKGDVIQISHIGFQTQSIIVKDEVSLTIPLNDEVQYLNETVVMGYVPEEKRQLAKAERPDSQTEEVFEVVEEMPQFPGGDVEVMKFIGRTTKYPIPALEAKIEGRVIVQFVVGKDGSISDIEIYKGVNPDLDAEAIRVIGAMPKWIPGKQRGKNVAVKYCLPINFKLWEAKEETD